MVLSIRDEGCGIELKTLDKLGKPFHTTKKNGTGLGLNICYNIAERHNATVDFESGPNRTEFFVRFLDRFVNYFISD